LFIVERSNSLNPDIPVFAGERPDYVACEAILEGLPVTGFFGHAVGGFALRLSHDFCSLQVKHRQAVIEVDEVGSIERRDVPMESKSRLEGGNPVTPGPEESSVIIHTRKRRRLIGVLFVLFSLLTLSHSIDSVARNVLAKLAARRAPEPVVETSTTVTSTAKVSTSFSFKDLDLHPDLLFQPYTAVPLLPSSTTTNGGLIASF